MSERGGTQARNLTVWAFDEGDAESLKLSRRLSADLCVSEDPPEKGDWVLFYEDDALFLYSPKFPEYKPFCVDYLEGEFARRWRRFTRDDILFKAIGHKKEPTRVFDATCGLGYDAFYLATVPGVEVTACERNVLLAELAMNAFLRVKEEGRFEEFPLYFMFDDAKEVLARAEPGEYDVIYLDPMYPRDETQSAKQKKELFLIRELVGSDQDAEELFELAWRKAGRRVVVKRPDKSPEVSGGREPNLQVKGNTVRYDVYLRP